MFFSFGLASANDADDALAAARDRYPATDFRSAVVTQLPGIYEFDVGGETVYGDKTARFLILGKLVDMDDLAGPGARFDEVADEGFLLQDGAAGEIALFSDPNCPYCAMFEHRLLGGELENWRISVILVRATNGPAHVAGHILCAKNPKDAYRSYLVHSKEPAPCAGQGIARHEDIAASLGVSATPTFMVPSGAIMAGLPDPDSLRSWALAGQRR